MTQIYFFIQIRMGSNRLPGKVLKSISNNLNVVELLYNRIEHSKYFTPENTIFLTTTNRSDDTLVEYFDEKNWNYSRGDENNVFSRFHEACKKYNPNYFFRICADNPFIEPRFLDELADFVLKNPQYDYVSFSDIDGNPTIKTHYGFFGEIVSAKTLLNLKVKELDKSALEHVTSIFYEHPDRFRIKLISMSPSLSDSRIRLTIDTIEDLKIIKKIYPNLKPNFDINDVYHYLQKEKKLFSAMKKQIERNKK